METLQPNLADLSPEQRRLVEHWLQKERATAAGSAQPRQIPRRSPAQSYPLSFAQQRFWLLQQLDPASPAYYIRTIVRLDGRLDLAALARSLNVIVQRHETLRTSIPVVDGQPRQVIASTGELPVPLVALDRLPPDRREAELQRLALEVTEQPFDLARGPLLRVCLLRLGPEEHVLLLTLHHIISDGWSQGIQLRELMVLYAADVAGRPAPLPDLPIQYADFAIWQRQSLKGERLSKQLAYWRNHLGRTAHVLELPADRPRPEVATYHGAWDYYPIPTALLEQVKELSRRAGATIFMTLLAAFDLLLYRYTGETDIVVGTPVAGRTRGELEGLIGCFMNTLALRTNLGGNPTFRELIQRVRGVTLGAYANQEVPFEQVVEELQPTRDMSRNPIFQVMFNLQNSPLPALKGPGLSLTPLEVVGTTSLLDLSFYIREWEHELVIRAEYNTDLFDATTIHRMLGHYRTLLEGIVAAPDQRLDALPLLTADERRQLPAVEEALADLWANMLGRERVGIHDNFFDTGGHPEKAAQLLVRMRETFQANLSPRSLFETPTVAAMAELIVAHEARPGQTEQIARMLKRLKSMPAADRQKLLEQKRRARGPA